MPAVPQKKGTMNANRMTAKTKKQKKAETDHAPDIDPAEYLTVVPTPFLNESEQRDSPQGAPCDDPNHPDAVICPWCRHKFVNRGDSVAGDAKAKSGDPEPQEAGGGYRMRP